MVPNKNTLRGADTAVQTIYMWICNFSDENGVCFPSRTTLANCSGCSVKTVDRSVEMLCNAGLLKKISRKDGDRNMTNLYQLMIAENDWGSDSQSLGRDSQSPGVGTHSRTELNPVLTQTTEVSNSHELPFLEVFEPEEDARLKRPTKAKYADAKIAFSWLPNQQKSWDRNITELECGLLLFGRGEEDVRKFVKYIKNHENDDHFNWVFVKPSDYERKWEDIKAYAKRNS